VTPIQAMTIAGTQALYSGLACGVTGLYRQKLPFRAVYLCADAALTGGLLAAWISLPIIAPAQQRMAPTDILFKLLLICVPAALPACLVLGAAAGGWLLKRRLLLATLPGKKDVNRDAMHGAAIGPFDMALLRPGPARSDVLLRAGRLRAQPIRAAVAAPSRASPHTMPAPGLPLYAHAALWRNFSPILTEQQRLRGYARRFAVVAHDVTAASQLTPPFANAGDNIHELEFQRDMLITARASNMRVNTLIARLRQPGEPPGPPDDATGPALAHAGADYP
jgi:hypothetical protein